MCQRNLPWEAEESTTFMEEQPNDQTLWQVIKEVKQGVHHVLGTPSISTELQQYLTSPLAPEDINPLHYWRKYKMQFPGLSKLARKYLSSPATSAASERAFSKAGLVYSDQRKRLQGEKAEMILLLNANLKFLNFHY